MAGLAKWVDYAYLLMGQQWVTENKDPWTSNHG